MKESWGLEMLLGLKATLRWRKEISGASRMGGPLPHHRQPFSDFPVRPIKGVLSYDQSQSTGERNCDSHRIW